MVHQLAHQRQTQHRANNHKRKEPTGLVNSTQSRKPTQKPVQKSEQRLMDWLCSKSERTATPCIAYLFKKGFDSNRAKQCFERVPLRKGASTEEIASEIARRLVKMQETQRVRSPLSQEFIAVAVQMEGTIACWSGEKWVKTRNFKGRKNTLRNHPGRLALLMLMNAI